MKAHTTTLLILGLLLGGCKSFELGTYVDRSFTETVKGVPFKMVAVEGGAYQMGDTYQEGERDESLHLVKLNHFLIGEGEVSQELWETIMGTNPSRNSGCPQCPVENVSWEEAQTFIRILNAYTERTYRLPTEAEWEYAARGGQRSKVTVYAGSNNLDEVAWHVGNSKGCTYAIGSKAPNELGLHHMTGNLWEWCSDRYALDYYKNSSTVNPQGPETGALRVYRGGSYANEDEQCRLAFRSNSTPDYQAPFLGFRLALSQP